MSGKTLTRADLAEAVFQKVGLPRNESAEIVELVLREIVSSLEHGKTEPFVPARERDELSAGEPR